ncbi:hypothetical protein BD779DRAFT_1416908, partial [Infundibulicybe gibba]
NQPLAYVEWFTSLGCPDALTGMHLSADPTRSHRRNTSIVTIDRIARGCHLI